MIELNPLESYVEPMEFNWEEAKKNLSRIEHEKKETLEKKRLTLLNKAKSLLGYFDKQKSLIRRLYNEISKVDVSVYEKRCLFALKTEQLFTALEDLLKQIAKTLENNIDELSTYHKALLIRMSTDIPKFRPRVISDETFLFLDKLRAFRHFIRHAYDCELDEKEVRSIQTLLIEKFPHLEKDLDKFTDYLSSLTK